MRKINLLAIIQARMGSTRLPGKVMMTVGGKPLIRHQIDRLKSSKLIDQIVVATTNTGSDDELVEYLESAEVAVFRGDEEDVLMRFFHCVDKYKPQFITRTTADCPFIDPLLYDRLLRCVLSSAGTVGYGSLSLKRIPRGFDIEAIAADLIRKAHASTADPFEREHVTPYIWRRGREVGAVVLDVEPAAPDLRLCVDEIADLELVRRVADAFGPRITESSYAEIVNFLRANPGIAQINARVEQERHLQPGERGGKGPTKDPRI